MKTRARRGRVMSEINITPLTDIVLVLLIIFMITTPLIIQSGIKVKLPQAASGDVEQEKNLSVAILPNGDVCFEDRIMDLVKFKERLAVRLKQLPNTIVVVQGDRDAKYDHIVRVLDAAKQAGATKFSLGTDTRRRGADFR